MEISFFRCRASSTTQEGTPPFSGELRLPRVYTVISHDAIAGTLRFDGYFHDEDDGAPNLPRVAQMSGVGIVRILEKVVGPNTNSYGNESDRMAIARTHAAAASSAPFEPIPAPEPPSELELQLRVQEREKLDAEREAAEKLPGYDEFDWMNVCYTSTQIIDLRYELV
jgi:hypothetical protein